MAIQFTRPRFVATRDISAPADPCDGFKKRVEECRQRFRSAAVTPQSALELENELAAIGQETFRQIVEQEMNRVEPDDKKKVPSKVRYHRDTYRLNKKTPLQVATRFGAITLRSFYYLNEQDGEPGLHPLRLRLGIGAGSATLALLERVARVSVDHTQAEARAWLVPEHGLTWSNDRLRAALAGFRQALLPFVPGLQKARLLAWLKQAEDSRGRHRPA